MENRAAPWPLLTVTIEPKSEADRAKLERALADHLPSVNAGLDPESGKIILIGMEELDLDRAVQALINAYDVDANYHVPKVACRAVVTRTNGAEHTHTRGVGQFARVSLAVQPIAIEKGVEFASMIAADALPKVCVDAVELGVRSVVWSNGFESVPLAGVKVTLMDADYDEASAEAFGIAARITLESAIANAGVELFEPIMLLEAVTPASRAPMIVGELKGRRGKIQGQQTQGDRTAISALVPLATSFKQDDWLMAISDGTVKYTTSYSHYEKVPSAVANPPLPPAGSMALRA